MQLTYGVLHVKRRIVETLTRSLALDALRESLIRQFHQLLVIMLCYITQAMIVA